MSRITCEWDKRKATTNKTKHGISFEEAKTVFFDDFARVIHDPANSDEEDRFIIMGISSSMNTLVVCHCYKQPEGKIRIISARKATRKESKQYEGFSYGKRI